MHIQLENSLLGTDDFTVLKLRKHKVKDVKYEDPDGNCYRVVPTHCFSFFYVPTT